VHHENLCVLDRVRTEEIRIELDILWLNKRNNGMQAKLIKYIQLVEEETQRGYQSHEGKNFVSDVETSTAN
jgi:hypothetical protein